MIDSGWGELGVSHMPVREALKQLAAEGIVEYLPYRGMRVVEFTPEDIEDIYAVRAALEGRAARAAAQRLSPQQIDELRSLLAAMAEAPAVEAPAANGDIDSIDCPDDTTTVVTFAELYAPYLRLFSYIVPQAAGDPANLDNWEYNRAPIGTGPWVVQEWKAGDQIVYAKNPNYREAPEKPYLDGIIVKILPSREVGMQLLGTGEIHALWDLIEADFAALDAMKDQGVGYASAVTGENELLVLNFADPTVDAPDGVGCRAVLAPIFTRSDAADPAALALFDQPLRAVFMLGGDQTVAMQALIDTPAEQALAAAHAAGAVVAGTSAGGAMQSTTMLGGYTPNYARPTHWTLARRRSGTRRSAAGCLSACKTPSSISTFSSAAGWAGC